MACVPESFMSSPDRLRPSQSDAIRFFLWRPIARNGTRGVQRLSLLTSAASFIKTGLALRTINRHFIFTNYLPLIIAIRSLGKFAKLGKIKQK